MLIDMLIIINNIVDNNKRSVIISEFRGGLFYETPKNMHFCNINNINNKY